MKKVFIANYIGHDTWYDKFKDKIGERYTYRIFETLLKQKLTYSLTDFL